jgi:excisionase family DNA binding protein
MRKPRPTNRLRPVKAAAKVLSISAYSFYEKLRLGELPYYRFWRKVLVDVDEVREAMRRPAKVKGGPRAA